MPGNAGAAAVPGSGRGTGAASAPGRPDGPGNGQGPRSRPGNAAGDGFGAGPGTADGFGNGPGNGTGTIAGARAGRGGAAAVPPNRKSGPSLPDGDEETGTGAEGGLAELRQKLRTQRRLRLITLSTLAIVVLLVLPAFFGLRAVGNDPVFASLNALDVPAWADKQADDKGSGSRWCFLDCRFRERVVQSERQFQETTEAYTKALSKAGWTQWKVAECPETPVRPEEGTYTCWRRDEFTLDLAVGLPGCAVDQVAQDALPAAGTEEAEAGEAGAGKCEGSTVSIKVRNEIADERGKPDTRPGPVGETPDPVLNENDPLLAPTPEAS
ncbi:hypothetical protein [Actinoplanes siamensis]|uniref:hypothetical protein n=1 Tax=Actinoplanes siamensis TaxID=1223317 RepID=UPI0023B238F2|nr:hypothetical protein [Actinoplanes siamensis]